MKLEQASVQRVIERVKKFPISNNSIILAFIKIYIKNQKIFGAIPEENTTPCCLDKELYWCNLSLYR